MEWFKYVLIIVISYLLGSINIAILITKYIKHDDIREKGSCNAGATNVARVFGLKFGVATLLGDFLKTVIAMLIGRMILGNNGYYLAALACMFGHCWPLYFHFRGGKGVAVGAGIALMLDWRLFLLMVGIFAVVFVISRIVSASSIITAIFFPIGQVIFGITAPLAITLGVAVALIVILLHRGNIIRLIKGTESKFNANKKNNNKSDV